MSTTNLNEKDQNIKQIAISDLCLDPLNPRFGADKDETFLQDKILKHIVENFSVEDVLSSISVNGFFKSEPLICFPGDGEYKGKYIVAEGNRRLAACIILSGDPRAKEFSKRTEAYQAIWEAHGKKSFDPVPVIVYDKQNQEKELLSFLGVRHIAGSQKWDSYAKAAWVAEVIDNSQLSIDDVVSMIGDSAGTASRLLEGYYIVQQLQSAGLFEPKHSMRKGRGSSALFPFSWVYTLIGYTSVREYLKLDDFTHPNKKPLKDDSLQDAANLFDAMFGNRALGKVPQLNDSREIGELAKVVSNKYTAEQLITGKRVRDIAVDLLPIEKRLSSQLTQARHILRDVSNVISESKIDVEVAKELLDNLTFLRRIAKAIDETLNKVVGGDADEL